MSSTNTIGNEGTVEARADEHVTDEHGETPELRASVDQEIQARIDYADERELDGRLFGQTLEAEERMRAREWEIERTRVRFDRRAESDREARSRRAAARVSAAREEAFSKRAASVDPWQDPGRADPREEVTREELGAVNREAARLAERLDGWSRAAIGRRLAERIADGADVADAVLAVAEEVQTAPGRIVPIAKVGEVQRREVSIAGEVAVLWEPSHPKIAQVGLVADDTGRIKVTVWKASRQPWLSEGERVRIRGAAKNWYEGRVSVALTGRSRVTFPDRGRWWA